MTEELPAVNHVDYREDRGIAYITLNRPEVLNALTDGMIRELREAFVRFDRDDAAKVAILSGNGRAFSSGADVRQRQLRSREEMERLGTQGRGAYIQKLFVDFTTWKPIISAVHGYVMGAALYIALRSEMIVAARGTRFQITETSRGADATNFWALLANRSTGAFATEMALTGRFYTAEEAYEEGAAEYLADEGRHIEVAEAIAERYFLSTPQSGVRSLVSSRRGMLEEVEHNAFVRRPRDLHLTRDFQESARAFVEKRTARYTGH
jgi:enoyl-CoA hydratase/carnithine racemase